MTIDELIEAAKECGPWRVRETGMGTSILLNRLGRCPLQAVACRLGFNPYDAGFHFAESLGLTVDTVADIAEAADGIDGPLRARLLRELVGVDA